MASRRRAREFALLGLYRADLIEAELPESLAQVWSELVEDEALGPAAEDDEVKYARRLVAEIASRREEIDALIDKASANWRLVRMPVVDRNILRLAACELLAFTDVPASVSINEAVELAKRYGDKDSRAFVNGILDRIAFETGRGGRRHRG